MPFNTKGWINDPDAVAKTEEEPQNGAFAVVASALRDSGEGKTILLYANYYKLGMKFPVLNQGNLGSCTAVATSGAIDCLKVTEIVNGDRESFKALTAPEPIYYGARRYSNFRLGGDGAVTAYAAKYINVYGVTAAVKYPFVDLSTYNIQRCRDWGNNRGFPKELEELSKEHPVTRITRVRTWEECRDSIANGYPVIVGSNQGFSNYTDNMGFAKPSGSWSHCMAIMGIRHDNGRPGAAIVNSWSSNWIKIAKKNHDQPDGSFWADANVIDRMMKSDAWSLAGFQGYKKKVSARI